MLLHIFKVCENLVLLSPSIYNHLNHFSNSGPLSFILTLRLSNFRMFSNPLDIRIPVYLALEGRVLDVCLGEGSYIPMYVCQSFIRTLK